MAGLGDRELLRHTGAREVAVERLAWQGIGEHVARRDQAGKVDARFIAHAVKHEHEVFGVDVARRARRMRAAAKSGERRVEFADAVLQRDQRIREAEAARVVEMQRAQLVARDAAHESSMISPT